MPTVEKTPALPLFVNGEERFVRSLNLAGLLEELSLEKNTVIAELNGVIVPVEAFSSRALNAGDRVELVRFVGGG